MYTVKTMMLMLYPNAGGHEVLNQQHFRKRYAFSVSNYVGLSSSPRHSDLVFLAQLYKLTKQQALTFLSTWKVAAS